MKVYKKYIFLLFSLISIFLIILFKSIPTGKLWNEYLVLYTSVETPEHLVINAIQDNGITDYICLSNQFLPLHFSENSPEISMYRINSNNKLFEYGIKRNAYFFDKSNNYKLYYIPTIHKNKLSNIISALNSNGIKAAIGESSTYPFILPILIIVFCVILALLSKNKSVYVISSLIPVIFIFCNPFYQIALSTLFLLISIFIVSNLWNRDGFLKVLISQKFFIITILLTLLAAFSSSIKSGVLCIVEYFGLISIFLCIYYFEQYLVVKESFIPVLILNAKHIRKFGGNFKKIMLLSLTIGLIIFASSLLFSSIGFNNSNSKIMFPSSSKTQNEQLPQLEDYYRWYWNIQTFPYISLNNNNFNSNTVEFPKYIEIDDKIILKNYVFNYNQEYKQNIYENIDSLNFNSIEKLMKSQGNDFVSNYKSTANISISLFGIIIMIICFFILLFIYISAIIKQGLNKNEK